MVKCHIKNNNVDIKFGAHDDWHSLHQVCAQSRKIEKRNNFKVEI
jgi:hypothetical protein